jgi:hypothetical protein
LFIVYLELSHSLPTFLKADTDISVELHPYLTTSHSHSRTLFIRSRPDMSTKKVDQVRNLHSLLLPLWLWLWDQTDISVGLQMKHIIYAWSTSAMTMITKWGASIIIYNRIQVKSQENLLSTTVTVRQSTYQTGVAFLWPITTIQGAEMHYIYMK